jgi:hypothetical protein
MERRTEERFAMLSKTIVTLVDAPENEHLCLLSDISASGMRLQSSERLPQGALACVELENHLVLVEIRYSYPRGGTFATGAMKLHTALKLGLPADLSRREKVQYLTNDYRQSGDYEEDGIALPGHQHSFDNKNHEQPSHSSTEWSAEGPAYGQSLSHDANETRNGAAHEPVTSPTSTGISAGQGRPSNVPESQFTPLRAPAGDSKPVAILTHGIGHTGTKDRPVEASLETAATVEPVVNKEEARPDVALPGPQNAGPKHPALQNRAHEPIASSPGFAAEPRLSEASEHPGSSALLNGASSIAQPPPSSTGTLANAPPALLSGNGANLLQDTELDSNVFPVSQAASAEQSLQRLRKLVEEEVLAKPLPNRKNTKGMAAFAASLALIAAGAVYFGVLQKPRLEAKSAGSAQQNRTEGRDALPDATRLDLTSLGEASSDSTTAATGSVQNEPQSQREQSTSGTREPVPAQQSASDRAGAQNSTLVATNVNSTPKSSSTSAAPVQVLASAGTQPSPAGGANSTQAQPAPATQRVLLKASAINWVSICTDGKKPFAKVMYEGDELTITFTERAALRMGNAGAAQVEVNGKPVGPVGPPGGLRIVELTPSGSRVLPTQPGGTVDCSVK